MDKQKIKAGLKENHNSFISFISGLSDDAFLMNRNEKWTAGQQLEHIYLSVKPFRQVMGVPKFLPKLLWGKSNRTGRSYEQLVEKYLKKLADGGRATSRFVPKMVPINRRDSLVLALRNEVDALCNKLDNFTELELDSYLIPHPLLGKLTVREMAYFTIFHVAHHQGKADENLHKQQV